MLKTRLIVGTVLAALTAGMLLLDRYLAPWFPFLLLLVLGLSVLATLELRQLLPPGRRPYPVVCMTGVIVVVLANWVPMIPSASRLTAEEHGLGMVGLMFSFAVLAAFLVEMARYTAPGGSVDRIALTVWTVAYLGFLPAFLVQLQLGRAASESNAGAVALALAIFVPKGCDIGAYFTGRFLGRHRMTPVLSPKKTWEGAAGGLALAVAVSYGLNSLGPVIPASSGGPLGFGITVGVAGMFGDLAESLIKRDCERKDASQMVPGFGGVLDVVDSILFAAPVSYCWLH
jgi:phosphatidate cytidylyltransferase